MTDDEIVKRITQQCSVMVLMGVIGRKDTAQLFANHVLRLVYTHRVVVARWLATRSLRTN